MKFKKNPVKNLKRALLKAPEEIVKVTRHIQPVDLAEIWDRFTTEEQFKIFEILPLDYRAELFEYFPFEHQEKILEQLNTSQLAELLNIMAPDERADMFAELPAEKGEKLLSVMDTGEARDVRELLEYDENTAGGLMTTDFVTLSPGMTARQALTKIQESVKGEQLRNIYAVYCVDESNRLLSGVTLQRLITSAPDKKISDITQAVDRIKINVNHDQEKVAALFAHYDLLAAPVVDDNDILAGVITIDDIVDVIHEEVSEDMALRAGTEVFDPETGTIAYSVKSRWGWLMASFLGGLAGAVIISFFEGALAEVAALAVFIPVIINMAGNVGIQSSTVVVRRLAEKREKYDWKEIASGELLAGLITSLGFGVFLWLAARWRYTTDIAWASGLGIALALLLSTVLGVFLPLFFDKHKIDPAVSTGPLITTALDIIGLGVYFLLAVWIVL